METIEIRRAKNGWVVYVGDPYTAANPTNNRDVFAFETFSALTKWQERFYEQPVTEVNNG